MKRRIFYKGILNHCYQRSFDGGVLFYTFRDHLVFFTQYCVSARKHHIDVLGLCQMPDHLHDSIRAERRIDLERFKRESLTAFSKKWNQACGTNGAVWEASFGSSVKFGDKNARSNLIYVGNNPVERKLVERAEEYRWNYLAYARSDHPFSETLVLRDARWPLQKAVREIKAQRTVDRPLNYAQLQRLFAPLQSKERLQLTDYIIHSYNVIDYPATIRFFGSYENMLSALHATTGSEHDLNEIFVGKSDAHYVRMTATLLRHGPWTDIHQVLSLDTEEKYELFRLLRRETEAPAEQIANFLHLTFRKDTQYG